jgi:chloride channel 3/4/5
MVFASELPLPVWKPIADDRSSEQWKMVNSLLLATIIRIGFIIISYGCKVPCGIFVPSMAVGACFGRMIGIVVKALHA